MTSSSHLQQFVDRAAEQSRSLREPADCVLAIAPLMFDLIERDTSFLLPAHYRSSPDGYTRNLIYEAPDDSLSLYSIGACFRSLTAANNTRGSGSRLSRCSTSGMAAAAAPTRNSGDRKDNMAV